MRRFSQSRRWTTSVGPIGPQRLQGYRLAHASAQLTVEESLIISSRHDMAEAELCRLLALPTERRPTAIVCSDQLLGCHVLDVLASLRLAVPQDMSVISGGLHPFPEPVGLVHLSRFDEGPAQRLGQLAVELLLTSSTHAVPKIVWGGSRYVDCGSVAPLR